MFSTSSPIARPLLSLTLLLAAACQRPTVAEQGSPLVAASSAMSHAAHDAKATRGAEKELAAVKAATARFQRFEESQDAGYTTQVTACWQNQPVGAMGFHYGNTTLFDGAVEVERPEVLLYEPDEHGRMKLVGVEWIIPFDQWHSDEPPVLMGRPLMKNFTFNVWALHAWIWKHNPDGMFADWNPTVKC